MQYKSLIENSNAYKIIRGDISNDRLSHAYLIIHKDGETLKEFLKEFAKLILCKQNGCGICRECRLIDEGGHPDVISYPKKEEKGIVTEDVEDLISKSYIKSLEGGAKVFILNNAQTMNVQAQNKILKTLEEPPFGVCILIGATTEFPLLPTLKSRVKTLTLSEFSDDVLMQFLKEECTDSDMLKNAVVCSDGTVNSVRSLYFDQSLIDVYKLASDVIVNLNSSKDVLYYSEKIAKSKIDFNRLTSVMELVYRDMLMVVEGRSDLVRNQRALKDVYGNKGYTKGALIHVLESITESNKRKKSNANSSMLIEWLLFRIVEGKYKWRK